MYFLQEKKILFTYRARVTPPWFKYTFIMAKVESQLVVVTREFGLRAWGHISNHQYVTFPGPCNTWLFGRAIPQKWTPTEMLVEMEKLHWLRSWSLNPWHTILALAVSHLERFPPESHLAHSLTSLCSVITWRARDPSIPVSETTAPHPHSLCPQSCCIRSSQLLSAADTLNVPSFLYYCNFIYLCSYGFFYVFMHLPLYVSGHCRSLHTRMETAQE